MLEITRSGASAENPGFKESKRQKGEDNLKWLERHAKERDGKNAAVVLLGARKNPCALRLRIAQAHARDDLSPSHWSHAVLLGNAAKRFGATPAFEISLEPPDGFGWAPHTNGVQAAKIARYGDASAYPNVALLSLPVPAKEVHDMLGRFQQQRSTFDACELVVRWLGFVWGVGRTGNPLLEGYGIPSAVMLEYVIGAAGFDLTPGLASRASCPEAIWQSAKYWHEYHGAPERVAEGGRKPGKAAPIMGAWTFEHVLE